MSYKKKPSLAKFPDYIRQANNKDYVYIEGYRNMAPVDRVKKMAFKASNNGKCWWVYEWLKNHSVEYYSRRKERPTRKKVKEKVF